LKDTQPLAAKPYRLSPDQQAAADQIIQEYLERGVVEESSSEYAAAAFLAPKPRAKPSDPPSKKWRLVEDYRALNDKLHDPQSPVPAVQDLLDQLGPRVQYMGSIDLRQGYHHIPIAPEDRHITAFATPRGQFQYKVLPYGLKTAPRLFQKTMQTILKDLVGQCCLIYLDDVVVYGATFEEYCRNLEAVLRRLTEAGAAIAVTKSVFLAEQLEYLGHIITREGVQPTRRAVKAVLEYPLPKTKQQLQRFMGLATYVRKFVPHFAELEAAVRAVMPLDKEMISWSEEARQAFEVMRTRIADSSELFRFDPALPVQVHADASATSLGAMLAQVAPSGEVRVLEFASRVLTDVERRYSNTERELLAILWAVTKKFRS